MSENRQVTNDKSVVSQSKTRWTSDSTSLAELEEAARTIRRTIQTMDGNIWGPKTGESFSDNVRVSAADRANHLRSTQKLRKLLLNNEAHDDATRVKSEEIFIESVTDLLNRIDECARNPGRWSSEDTNFYFNKAYIFVEIWKRQLMQEKEKLNEEARMVKKKMENKQDLITNRLSILTSVFDESSSLIEFSESQTKAIVSMFRELNDFEIETDESGEVTSALAGLSLTVKTENEDVQPIENRKPMDDNLEGLEKTEVNPNKLKNDMIYVNPRFCATNDSAKVEKEAFAQFLQVKEHELNECRKEVYKSVKEQLKTLQKLKETQEAFSKLMIKNSEMAQSEQEAREKLSEIRTMLMMRQPGISKSEIEDLSKKDSKEILKDIKALIEFEKQLVNGNNSQVNTADSVTTVETGGGTGTLKVTEYEMHLVTLIACFLKLTPFPVSASYIYSYVSNIDNTVDLQFVEGLLKKFPSFFKEATVAPGSNEKNWSYLDLKPTITI